MIKFPACLFLVFLLFYSCDLDAAEFVDVGVGSNLIVNAISADGSLVAGRTLDEDWKSEAFIWTNESGVQVLGEGRATDASGDGSIVVGVSNNEIFRWSEAGGKNSLGRIPGYNAGIPAISDDGSIVVATGHTGSPNFDRRAFRWTEADGWVSLLPTGATKSAAGGISADGNAIGIEGLEADEWNGFVWDQQNGFQSLGAEPSGWTFTTRPMLVSANGQVIFGNEALAIGGRGNPFRWTAEDGIQRLPILEGVDVLKANGSAEDITPDGSVLIGDFCGGDNGDGTPGPSKCVSYVWDEQHGTRDLRDVLVDEHGFLKDELPLLESARGISADAMIVAGYNNALSRTSPQRDAWIVYLDKPLISPPGDFNEDHYRNADDIDLLSQAILAGSFDENFDLNADGLLNGDDREFWVSELARIIFGDADLDQDVDFDDFLALSSGFDEPGGWSEGDFTGDGQVSFDDFLSLSKNFGVSAAATSVSVPEPTDGMLPSATILLGLLLRRQRRSSNSCVVDRRIYEC